MKIPDYPRSCEFQTRFDQNATVTHLRHGKAAKTGTSQKTCQVSLYSELREKAMNWPYQPIYYSPGVLEIKKLNENSEKNY